MEVIKNKKKNISIIIVILVITIIGLSTYFIISNNKDNVTANNEETTNQNTTTRRTTSKKENNLNVKVETKYDDKFNKSIITVDVIDDFKVTEYSFDNGVTWQKSNKYEATSNGTLKVLFKDTNGNIVGSNEYVIDTIDDEGPDVVITLPTSVEENSKINVNDYIKVTDKSGLKDIVEISPANIDTSKIGPQELTVKAIDKFNNETIVTTSIVIVKKDSSNNQNPTSKKTTTKKNTSEDKKTYYRYRTKTISNYSCGEYDCNYVDHNKTTKMLMTFGKDSYCCDSSKTQCNKTSPLIILPVYGAPDMQTGLREPKYQIKDNVCYDIERILVPTGEYISKTNCDIRNEINVDGFCHKIESYKIGATFESTSHCSGKITMPQIANPCPKVSGENIYCTSVMVDRYKVDESGSICYDVNYISVYSDGYYKTKCDADEILYDGYCHKVDSYGYETCPTGYTKVSNTSCAKVVEKKCSKTCQKEVWSEWSSWSTTKVNASTNIEVQTKTM